MSTWSGLKLVRVCIALPVNKDCLSASNAIFALSKCLHQGTDLGKSVPWGYLWNCWEYISETQLQVFDSARQGAVSLADIEYLPAVPVGYMKEVTTWSLCPCYFLSLPIFFPHLQNTHFQKPFVWQNQRLFSEFWEEKHNGLTFTCKKRRCQDTRCFEGSERTNLKTADRGKLMSRIVNYLSLLTIWCTLGQLPSWHSSKTSVPRGQMLVLQNHSWSWHLRPVEVILQEVSEGQCGVVNKWFISVALKSA